MTNNDSIHSFHIPVMGLAYTIDTPIRVAQYGISSVVSIADDDLIEKMRVFYNEKFKYPYQQISQKIEDYRAKRITSYLDLVDTIVKEKFEDFKAELTQNKTALENFVALLPSKSDLWKELQQALSDGLPVSENIKSFLDKNLKPGAIDVNIMTKLDKDNFSNNIPLPIAFNDAHAAVRGFAKSTVSSSLVLSAGMNPRLYSYIENFDDFYPDNSNTIKKKITLKVSDFRSALIQGNFLAKKGIWVSEYRIESGLNCGGHAFATDGYLLGPILEEFKEKKAQLIQSSHELMIKALTHKERFVPETPLALKITFQGGVGTANEHDFLLNYYQLDSVGWGSPFLLVPEATSVDQQTRNLLAKAKEDDLYLSQISPLGVPFNTIKGSTNELLKQKRIQESKAGSSCPKKFLALTKDANGNAICTASKKYQDQKLQELDLKKPTLATTIYEQAKNRITEKACLCVGLANASYLENNIKIKGQDQGVVICPGPNIAYFDKEVSLLEMCQHIYGKGSVLPFENRPNFLVNELKMYVAYLKNDINTTFEEITIAKIKKWDAFKTNLITGIDYYKQLLKESSFFEDSKEAISQQLDHYRAQIQKITMPVPATA